MDSLIKKPLVTASGSEEVGLETKTNSNLIIPPPPPPQVEHPICSVFANIHDVTSTRCDSWDELKRRARHPSSVPKTEAECIAAHTVGVKTKAGVLAHNSMTMLWVDVDAGDKALDELNDKLIELGIESAIIYSTASSSLVTGKKWRILIQLPQPIECTEWEIIQLVLADEFGGDRSAARQQQILFAPNLPPSENNGGVE
jgi:hypothetical protein